MHEQAGNIHPNLTAGVATSPAISKKVTVKALHGDILCLIILAAMI
jgi:hypothetical protein